MSQMTQCAYHFNQHPIKESEDVDLVKIHLTYGIVQIAHLYKINKI